MSTEEAIAQLEDHTKYCVPFDDLDVFEMAVDALRAKQTKLDRSHWEGCEWCNQRYCDNCFWQIKMKDRFRCERCIDKSGWAPIVSYCSDCGRPLTEEAWAELERRINGGTADK